MQLKKALQCSLALPLLVGVACAQDSDLDGIPDAWESSHYLDPDNSADAHADFDRDGLTSLQEYQLSLLGKGEGLIGKWSATLVNLNEISVSGDKWVVALNDEGDVLVNLLAGSLSSAWVRKGSDGSWKQISDINGVPAFVEGLDLNNKGQVVGHARPASGGSSAFFGFIKDLNESAYDAGVSPWYSETDSINPVKSITAINNWGDVIGTRSDGTSFFQSDFYGDVSPPSTWTNAVFTALNDWGEVVGVEMSDPNYDMGLWSHFLLSEGWFSHLSFPGFVMPEHDLPEPDSEEWTFDNTYYSPSMINDWSDFSDGSQSGIQMTQITISPIRIGFMAESLIIPNHLIVRFFLDHLRIRRSTHLTTGLRSWLPGPGRCHGNPTRVNRRNSILRRRSCVWKM